MPDCPLTVLDELELLPGQLGAFLDAFKVDYQPGAEERGMTLQHVWVTPPFERHEGGTTVLLVWQLDGTAGFWTMRSQSGAEEVARWWQRCDSFVVKRTRRIAAESVDLTTLAAAGNLDP